jgi:Raf kinase inhibitor-like YbhB/YbcL family protein
VKLRNRATVVVGLGLLLVSCSQGQAPKEVTPLSVSPSPKGGEGGVAAALEITSTAFSDQGEIPAKYTCDGDNTNPPLSVNSIPEGTQSLVLIVDDPDAPAGVWNHWIVWNISPTTLEIGENSVPAGAAGGINDFGNAAWDGPCPPSGSPHRYFFRVYTLDIRLDLETGASRGEVEKATEGHVLAQAQLVGRYGR